MNSFSKIKGITVTALFSAVIFVTTSFIKFPIAYGYVHVGDVFILLSGFMLPPVYAVIASSVGSIFADLISGYVIYMPITFVAKAGMAFIASVFFYKKDNFLRVVMGSVLSSIFMLICYFIFEGFIYGWAPAIANLPLSCIQPAIAIILSVILISGFKKIPYFSKLKYEIGFNHSKKSTQNVKKGE